MRGFRWCLALMLAAGAISACKGNKDRRPPVAPTPALTAVQIADRHYDRGEYEQAIGAYEQALNQAEGGSNRHVLFRLAMSYMTLAPGPEGQERALELLSNRVSKDDPSPAGVLLGLLQSLQTVQARLGSSQREVRRLNEELERLRAIDLKRRPPGSPE